MHRIEWKRNANSRLFWYSVYTRLTIRYDTISFVLATTFHSFRISNNTKKRAHRFYRNQCGLCVFHFLCLSFKLREMRFIENCKQNLNIEYLTNIDISNENGFRKQFYALIKSQYDQLLLLSQFVSIDILLNI